ncbi:Putative ribonuclease H protein At1g65750, partial [Linum perenne]
SIRDGRKTLFRTDSWLDSGISLVDHAINFREVDLSLLVSHVCSEPGVWNYDFLCSVLPSEIVRQVVGMSPPVDRLGEDCMVWGLEANGTFSVRTTYLLIIEALSPPSDPIWSYIWKWSGPSKIKHFLWLALHKRLLTNEERGRRHLTNQVMCPRCSFPTESMSHVLYDCDFALQVWRFVLPQTITAKAEAGDFDSWWRRMLRDRDAAIKFGITAWILWGARNKLVFESLNQSVTTISEQCKFWFNLVLSSWKTNQLGQEAPGLAQQTQLIVWRPGDEAWSTLNTDGSRYHLSGSTAMGGLIRDENGRFVRAFTANIGDCLITRAELRAIVQGLHLAWAAGIRKVVVQSDSRAALAILQSGDTALQHAALVAEFRELCTRSWEVSLVHVFREANFAADYLANLGHSCSIGLHLYSHPDPTLAHWLRYDLFGVAAPRAVSLNS